MCHRGAVCKGGGALGTKGDMRDGCARWQAMGARIQYARAQQTAMPRLFPRVYRRGWTARGQRTGPAGRCAARRDSRSTVTGARTHKNQPERDQPRRKRACTVSTESNNARAIPYACHGTRRDPWRQGLIAITTHHKAAAGGTPVERGRALVRGDAVVVAYHHVGLAGIAGRDGAVRGKSCWLAGWLAGWLTD
jgi:hypothetical protein